MLLIKCENNIIISLSAELLSTNVTNQPVAFAITNTNLYLPVLILSTKDNATLLQWLKSGSKKTVNWNKYQFKVTTQAQNQYSNYLIDPSFQRINRLFLSYEHNTYRTSYKRHLLPTVETKDYNIFINLRNFHDQSPANDIRTYDNIQKITN